MFQRLWDDMRSHPGTWIGVGLAALLLVVGYLAYKNNQTSLASQANTSNTASGQPLWSTASVGSDPTAQPSNAEILAELASIAAYMQSQQTPNPPGVASPVAPLPTVYQGTILPYRSVNPPSSGMYHQPFGGPTSGGTQMPTDPVLHVGYTNYPPPSGPYLQPRVA